MPSDILNADCLLRWFQCDNLVGNGGSVYGDGRLVKAVHPLHVLHDFINGLLNIIASLSVTIYTNPIIRRNNFPFSNIICS